MNVPALLLSVSLTLGSAAPNATESKCPIADNRCQGARSARKAEAATNDNDRALALYAAHRSFMFLFDQTHVAEDLCRSRRYFNRGVELKTQSEHQRGLFERSRAELESREQDPKIDCKPRKRKPAEEEPPAMLPVTSSAAPPSEPPAAPPPAKSEPTPPAAAASPAAVSTVSALTPPPGPAAITKPDASTRSAVTTQVMSDGRQATGRRWTPRAWAGLGMLAGGAGLLGGTAASMHARQVANAHIAALDRKVEAANREPTSDETAAVARATARWYGFTAAAIVTGTIGAAALLTGAVLVGTGVRRRPVDVAPWGGVGSAGLVLRGRF